MTAPLDAIVIGSGPNGLAAAIALAAQGRGVLVVEASSGLGGGMRSAELTLPGFTHDLCSAVHPLAAASPFFGQLPLHEHGLEWMRSRYAVAHPFDDGTAAALTQRLDETAASLGNDGPAYRRLFAPALRRWQPLFAELLRPPLHVPAHPLLLARFGLEALRSAESLARARFSGEKARGLFAGIAAHSFLPLSQTASSAVALVLGLAGHAVGWPIPRGGSQSLANALASYLRSLGGRIETGARINDVGELPESRAVFFDLTPKELVRITGERLPRRYRRGLRGFRYGPGVCKVDWALSGPVPWQAAECRQATTVHVGGGLAAIASSERAPHEGKLSERPFVLFSEPTIIDPSRAPAGRHVAWGYCHVPHGASGIESVATERIEAQIERFAPGFRSRIIGRSVMGPQDLEARNPNLVGGDISGGLSSLGQLLFRPVASLNPYVLPVKGWYLCSSSTPPGAGVHGMCGFLAAQAAIKRGL